MVRLTKRTPNGVAYMAIADTLSKKDREIEGSKPILEGIYAIFQKLANYEETGLEPEQINKLFKMHMNRGLYNHIDELLNLEDEERLIKLLYKVGDTVWIRYGIFKHEVGKHKIDYIKITKDDCIIHVDNGQDFSKKYWKYLYRTKEDAEKTLGVNHE